MLAKEKEVLYNLLKSAANYEYGYVPEVFGNKDTIEFTDDKLISDDNQKSESKNSKLSLDTIKEKVLSCKNCPLYSTRKNIVLGMGVQNPLVLVVGEAPGAEEDEQGLPFVGPAGQLLDKMLAAINLSRSTNCYIANILKCRPPQNRTPKIEEANACIAYLKAQIHILKPKMILAMGRTAAQTLLDSPEGINTLRGRFFETEGITMLATYHPSALLRDPSLKRPAWEDLKVFASELQRRQG